MPNGDGGPPIRSENPHEPPDRDRLRRRCFAILSEAGLEGREDRKALASFVLGRPVASWSEFDNAEWRRITDACVGWVAFRELRRQSGKE